MSALMIGDFGLRHGQRIGIQRREVGNLSDCADRCQLFGGEPMT
jgi:hypothetical protein